MHCFHLQIVTSFKGHLIALLISHFVYAHADIFATLDGLEIAFAVTHHIPFVQPFVQVTIHCTRPRFRFGCTALVEVFAVAFQGGLVDALMNSFMTTAG